MGYMRHDVVVVTIPNYAAHRPDLDAWRAGLPAVWQKMVIGPFKSVINNFSTWVFLPDGSKEGWADSDAGDTYREQFKDLFRFRHDDGSTPDDWVHVAFGGDYGAEVGTTIVEDHNTEHVADAEV